MANDVPVRGDGFDSPTAITTTNIDNLSTQVAAQGLNIKALTIQQIMKLAEVSEPNARIIKNTIAGGGAGGGAIIAREINAALNNLLPEELAQGFGGFIGGFISGLINKAIKKPPSAGKSRYNNYPGQRPRRF